MREIKFRAWEKYMKEMIPVHDIDFKGKMINTESAWRFFDEVELMQYTELKDKNGKEIFEGDIIKEKSKLITFGGENTGEYGVSILKVFWDTDRWKSKVLKNEFKGGMMIDQDSDNIRVLKQHQDCLEVIGNIYENPDLL